MIRWGSAYEEAIKEADLKPGKDIIIVSMDGIKRRLPAIVDGEYNCTVECNPLLGPQTLQGVDDLPLLSKRYPSRI